MHVLSVVYRQEPRDFRREDGVWVHRARLVRRPRGLGRITRLRETWNRVTIASNVFREVTNRDLRPDVIECPSWNAEGLLLGRRKVAPLAVHVFSSADDILTRGLIGLDRRISIWMEHQTIAGADIVLSPPGQMAKVRERVSLDPEATVEIHCPVVSAPIDPVPPGAPLVCFVGRFEARKGPETLIRAWPKVLERVPEARLVLSGKDTSDDARRSYRSWLLDLARDMDVAGAVEVVERWGDYDQVAAEMSAATLVAVPSRWESFGYTAAEAQSLGRAVVASDLPSLAGVIVDGTTGRLVPAEDHNAWAEALADLLADPRRTAAMGRAGADWVTSAFDPDRIAAQTLAAYELAINRHSKWSR